jgi:UDP-N-acetylmuramate--alanine ligase
MNVFFSGIGGVALGPLAQIAHDAGYTVLGSDSAESLTTGELRRRGINVTIGQSGELVAAEHAVSPIDWFVYTAALPSDHPELIAARELGIRVSKRDELLSHIIAEKNLKLIAVSGTHGKTTTTGMMVWALQQLGVPVSYSIGSTISFGPSGLYNPGSDYFVYECDEFDKNFLHFKPFLSLVTSIGYDHSDTYPTQEEYRLAFSQFLTQSAHSIGWQHDFKSVPALPAERMWQLNDNETMPIQLAGQHNRRNATLVVKALEYLEFNHSPDVVKDFPGTNRRFERLAENIYSDYGHHPTEIAATLQMAREVSDRVVLVYQPHQNVRQHEIKVLYRNCFSEAEAIYWLPTYLSREDPSLPILSSEELVANISNRDAVIITDMDEQLWNLIESERARGALILCMGAGSIDAWLRKNVSLRLNETNGI